VSRAEFFERSSAGLVEASASADVPRWRTVGWITNLAMCIHFRVAGGG